MRLPVDWIESIRLNFVGIRVDYSEKELAKGESTLSVQSSGFIMGSML